MKSSAGVIALGEGADVGVGKKPSRKRAVGTREHIIAYLAQVNELFDTNGMASTQLAAAVGYPGSSVAFAQLLSGMERSGLIKREVRGKRTYRISAGSGASLTPGPLRTLGSLGSVGSMGALGSLGAGASAGMIAADGADGVGGGGFDYDELARRLLVQLVRRLAAADQGAGPPDASALRATVSALEEENVMLREQLGAAHRSLALARERLRKLPITTDLDNDEVVLLQRLLSGGSGRPGGDGSSGGLEDVRSLLG
jgi:hypothetical protein